MRELSYASSIAWHIAAGEAAAAKNQYIEMEHILIGICSLKKALNHLEPPNPDIKKSFLSEFETLEDIFRYFRLDPSYLRRQVREKFGKGSYVHTEKVIHRSDVCKKIFDRADKIAGSSDRIFCLHLLAAILENPGYIFSSVLNEAGVRPEDLNHYIIASIAQKIEIEAKHTHNIDRYCRDLTHEAQEGKLGPFIGRRSELLQIIQTLARHTKNNPVLVGEAGVGKTAIVEALAVRVAEGKDPHILAGKRILELNMGALVGGTKHRGDFEERLTRIVEEVRNHPEVIIFIDEIHNVIGAGKGEGSMDAANILKPSLACGDMRCIGATTIAEYRRYIESDPALERRFDKIIVNEPTRDEALEILKGIRPKLEEHHHVIIEDRALEAAVDLSIRFDSDHLLPDKAIDLVDKSGARVRVPILSLRKDKINDKTQLEGRTRSVEGVGEITATTIAHVLSEKIGIPLEVITGHLEGMSQTRLLELEKFLKGRLFGQDEAINHLCQRLLMIHAGLGKKRGPLAVFLFLGPSGVGKTELARLLAEFLFGNESELIRLDMSEYMEEHSGAKLIGSPPGYIGHDEEGQLTGKLRTKPYSVVLLDEIEKAHPRIFDLFLQVFDEGRLTDSKGRTANAKSSIFIMTSNIYIKEKGLNRQDSYLTMFGMPGGHRLENNFPDDHDKAMKYEIRKKFRPEFVNRIDEMIVFRFLSEEDVRKILKPMLNEIFENINKKHNVTLDATEDAERFISHTGYDQEYGVRELRRTVERLIQVPISHLILNGELKKHVYWKIVCNEEGIAIIPVCRKTL